MRIEFDLSQFRTTEFGLGRRAGRRAGQVVKYSLLAVDNEVQDALREETQVMLSRVAEEATNPRQYDPAEKYGNDEYLVLPLDHVLSASLAELHEAANLSRITPELQVLRTASSYFMRGTDRNGRRLTALNRATQFKATLGRQGRIMALVSDTLRVIPDPVMQLNAGFDIVIDSKQIHIFRPASFRTLGNVDEAVAQAVPRNVEAISQAAYFVEWSNIQEFATTRPRAASLLASIRTQKFAENLDKAALKSLCLRTGVEIDTSQEHIAVPDDQIIPFLEVIDRRRYDIDLVPNTPEQYKASSRTKIGGS